MHTPVMNEARADTRKQTRSAMSSGVAIRLSGYWLAASARTASTLLPSEAACWAMRLSQRLVAVAAGDTAVTRIFDGAPRSARPFEKLMRPEFAVPPVKEPGVGLRAAAPPAVAMPPPPCACIIGKTARAIRR